MGVLRFLWKIIKLAIYITIITYVIQRWLSQKDYIFSHEGLGALARKHVGGGKDARASMNGIIKDLRRSYGNHILPKTDTHWIFVNAGGWMGSMYLLHASLTEYVIFFGTPLDTGGHSGRYWANITDTLLSGQMKQWKEGELESVTYGPGETVKHNLGEAAGVHFAGNTWMLEYGRGFVPSALVFSLADTVFGTTDAVTLFYTARVYVKSLWQETKISIIELERKIAYQLSSLTS